MMGDLKIKIKIYNIKTTKTDNETLKTKNYI